MVSYHTYPSRHERVRRQAANGKNAQLMPMDPVVQNEKKMVSWDPSSFSSMLQGVFDAWYKQRFSAEQKQTTSTRQTTPLPTTRASTINKKALFNEFLTLAMDYFKPKTKQAKVTIPPKVTNQKIKVAKAAPDTSKVTKPPKTTKHPPIMTRKKKKPAPPPPQPKPDPTPVTEPPTVAENEALPEHLRNSPAGEPVQPAPQKQPARSKPTPEQPKNRGPEIDPELLQDINELRVIQGLPELRPDQVDQYGNILPKYRPPPPPSSPNRERASTQSPDIHSHSHGPHDHYHDHYHHPHDPYGVGYGTESYIQSSIRDTHARAHQMAGPLSANMHRELHRLLRHREDNLRREAWQQRRLREELFGRPRPVLQPIMDVGDLGDLARAMPLRDGVSLGSLGGDGGAILL